MSALSKYKTYPEYKDSGVEWLGEIPSHWKESLLRFLFSSITNGSTETQIEESSSTAPISRIETISSGFIDMERIGFVDQKKISPTFKLKIGDILFSHINSLAMVGNVAIYEHDENLYHGMNLLRMSPNTNIAHSKYILWLFKSKFTRNSFESIAKPAINQASISISALKQLQLVLPTLVEQTKIAQFLDHETAKIDQLIEKQQTLIELLKEKRQAVISHAVTKGLNPNIKMKDSGVEWLGEVPEHWQLLKATYLGKLFGSETILESDIKEEGSIPFLKVSNLSLNSFALESKSFFIGSNKINSVSPKNNYIVFPKRGAAIFTNKVNIIREDSLLDPNLMGWQINQNAIPEYIAFLLKLRRLDDIADISTVPQINNKHIEPQKFPIPPILEQREIIDFLDTQISKFDLLTQKAEEQIELMKERKTALISAAVTGKIDVRDWQPEQ